MTTTVKVIIGVVVFIILLGLIASPSETKTDAPAKEATVKQETKLSQRVQEAYLKQIGYNSLSELNLDADNIVDDKEQSIIEFKDNGSGNVDVIAQANLSRDELRQVGYSVLSAVNPVDGLKSVTVWGSNGIHRIVYVNDIQ